MRAIEFFGIFSQFNYVGEVHVYEDRSEVILLSEQVDSLEHHTIDKINDVFGPNHIKHKDLDGSLHKYKLVFGGD